MAIATSNPFSIGIRVPPTSSIPTVQDERDTYALWGWTWSEATANPAYNSAPGYAISNPDIHGDTEGDDVWNYLQAYNRRTTGRDGYLQRATAWRDYYVNRFEGSAEYNNDANNYGYDHFYGWGLQQYATQFSDSGAASEALNITRALHGSWSTLVSGNWPTPGVYNMSAFGGRYGGRNLRSAVAVADATSDANAIELRDNLIDLWIQSPSWDNTRGMYWVGATQMESYSGLGTPPYNMVYGNGDRAISAFHIGIIAEGLWAAYNSTGVSVTRKSALRAKLLKMALFVRTYGLDPTYRYTGNYIGIHGSNGNVWHSSSGEFHSPVTFWDQSMTIPIINLLVMGYKFTGDRLYLDGAVSNTNFPAKYVLNRYSKAQWGHPTAREYADNVVGHFQDTMFASPGFDYLAWNKGEFQYTYLIFENGGSPTFL